MTNKEIEIIAKSPELIKKFEELGELRKSRFENEESNEKSKEPECDSSREVVMEKINLIKGAAARKFGPNNLNTGRSGRIYTEEELCRQIKE